FFTWFCDDQDKTLLEVLHDEVAEVIKEDLWPNPLKYFNNVSYWHLYCFSAYYI
ncbi:hypothetical protein MKW98_017740, partial [Papaver atlanticum]